MNVSEYFFSKKNKSQTTIFIILAIVIVVGVLVYMLARNGIIFSGVPQEFEPVYNYYLGCIENEVRLASLIAGEHAGYIENPPFSPGSSYMPFSSHLDFLGNPVPYWYYISANNVAREQVPSKSFIEEEMNSFVAERLKRCDFSSFVSEGYRVELGQDALVKSSIRADFITTEVNQELNIYFGNDSYQSQSHVQNVRSSFGTFYDNAKLIYEDLQKTLFLESYGIDVLRLYAPLDGVALSCTPLVWSINDVRKNITAALEANTAFIKMKGDYYKIKNADNNYFVHDAGKSINTNVAFLYLQDWPMKMEVWPSDGQFLQAESIGLEEGFCALGFCYVPYHFVYDVAYPVLIQQYSQSELFQFPVVVYINKNRPREPMKGSGAPQSVPELCLYRNTNITVHTFDRNLNGIAAAISYNCFDTSCSVGSTSVSGSDASLTTQFPQCINGYVVASAPGYETEKFLFSTVEAGEISVVLDKKYPLIVALTKDGRPLSSDEYALVSFKNNQSTQVISYPQQKNVSLTEGNYEISAYVYSPTNIALQSETMQKCVSVPANGLGGIFGQRKENCFSFEIPAQPISVGVSAGGKQNYYITETELTSAKKISLSARDFGGAKSVSDIQLHYTLAESSSIEVNIA